MPTRRRTALAWLASMAVVVFVMMIRTTGIQNDENCYMYAGMDMPLGSVPTELKPVLFYWFNYKLYHVVGRHLGNFGPFVWHLFHAALTVSGLVWLCNRLAAERRAFWPLLALLLLSPIFVLNSTQFLMETPLLGLMAFAFGSLFRLASARAGRETRTAHLQVVVFVVLSVLVKPTALFGFLAFGAGFFPLFGPTKLASLIGGMAIGQLLVKIQPLFVHSDRVGDFGGPGNLLRLEHVAGSLSLLAAHLHVWLFAVWPALILVAGYALWSRRSAIRYAWARTALASLISVPFLVAMSNYEDGSDQARYHYPAIWTAVIGLSYLAAHQATRARAWLIGLVCLSYVVPASALWSNAPGRFDLWPGKLKQSIYHSGGTSLAGAPFLRWLATAGDRRQGICIFMPKDKLEDLGDVTSFFSHHMPGSKLFDEATRPQFDQCAGPKAIYVRKYVDAVTDECAPACDPKIYRYSSCAWQKMIEGRPPSDDRYGKLVMTRVCLP